MKKAPFIFFALAILLALACDKNPSGNVNGNANTGANSNTNNSLVPTSGDQPVKVAAKFVPGTPPELIITDVEPNPVTISNGQKINWVVSFDAPSGSTQKLSITIDDFRYKNVQTDLFGGGSKYEFRDLLSSGPIPIAVTGPANSATTPAEYKYRISFVLEGVTKITLDPKVVISN
jgi:hypothetical protein